MQGMAMSSPRTEKGLGRPAVAATAATALIALLALVGSAGDAASPAAAADPPPPEKAEIVFVNGGRIVSINADGSQRKVLTRKRGRLLDRSHFDAFNPVEDRAPSISPDGTRLLFHRIVERKGAPHSWTAKLMIANRDGSDPREVLRFRNGVIGDPSWDPGGDRIIFERWSSRSTKRGESNRYRILSVRTDGTDRRLLLERTYDSWGSRGYEAFMSSSIGGGRLSPDGTRLLYEEGRKAGYRLRVLDLETGADRVVAASGSGATWSPDGSRIAFGRGDAILTVDADGGAPDTVIRGAYDLGLDWSPDGLKLVFASARNYPGAGPWTASEIYSVAVEGPPCLTWLTNGSPASESPSWGPEVASTAVDACGDGGRPALVEHRPLRKLTGPGPHLWPGPSVRGRLLSQVGRGAGTTQYEYGDCPYFDPSRCRRPMMVESIPRCNFRAGDSVELGTWPRALSLRRSVPMVTTGKRRLRGSTLLTGRQTVRIGAPVFNQNRRGKPITMRDHLAAVRGLRPVSRIEPTRSALPRAAVLRPDLELIRRIERVHGRTGSIRATARSLKRPPAEVRTWLKLGRLMEASGPIRTFRCPSGR